MSHILVWEVYHGPTWRKFRTFDAAERWARGVVGDVDARGHSEAATIFCWGHGEVATVSMSGDGRIWTDLLPEALPIA